MERKMNVTPEVNLNAGVNRAPFLWCSERPLIQPFPFC